MAADRSAIVLASSVSRSPEDTIYNARPQRVFPGLLCTPRAVEGRARWSRSGSGSALSAEVLPEITVHVLDVPSVPPGVADGRGEQPFPQRRPLAHQAFGV